MAAFTQLRALTLCQTSDALDEQLLASQLPRSVQELTLVGVAPDDKDSEPPDGTAFLPALVGFPGLHDLRRLTFAAQESWDVSILDDEEGTPDPVHLPPSLQVRLASFKPTLCGCPLCTCTL